MQGPEYGINIMTTVGEFTVHQEAYILQTFLLSGGFNPVLVDEHAAAWSRAPLLVPIRVQVPDDQAEEALALLQEVRSNPCSDEELK